MRVVKSARLERLLEHERGLEATLLFTQVLLLVSSVVLARSVGAVGRGEITKVTVYGQLIGWGMCFSLDKAFLVLGRESGTDAGDTFRTTMAVAHLMAAPAAIGGLLVGHLLLDNWTFSVAMAIIAVSSLYFELYAAWLLLTARLRFLAFRIAQPLLYFAAAIGCSAAFGSVQSRTEGFVLAAAAASALPVLLARQIVDVPTAVWGASRSMFRRFARFAAVAQAANSLQYLNSRLDILYLAATAASAVVGVYAVGASIGQAMMFLASAGILRGVTGRQKRFDWAGVGGMVLVAALISVVAPAVVPRVFGDEFEGAIVVAQLLSFGAVLNFALQSLAGRLLGEGRPLAVAAVQGIGVPAFAVGIAISDSIEGVALSSVLSYGVSLLAAIVVTRRPGNVPLSPPPRLSA